MLVLEDWGYLFVIKFKMIFLFIWLLIIGVGIVVVNSCIFGIVFVFFGVVVIIVLGVVVFFLNWDFLGDCLEFGLCKIKYGNEMLYLWGLYLKNVVLFVCFFFMIWFIMFRLCCLFFFVLLKRILGFGSGILEEDGSGDFVFCGVVVVGLGEMVRCLNFLIFMIGSGGRDRVVVWYWVVVVVGCVWDMVVDIVFDLVELFLIM